MLKQLINNVHYQVTSDGVTRQFIARVRGGEITLSDVIDGEVQTTESKVSLTDDEWRSIDIVGEPPLLPDRAYLVLVNGSWTTSLWIASNTRIDLPTQYCFSSLSVPFGAGIEKTILVPLPEESDDWIEPSFALPAMGAEVIHWDKACPRPSISIYKHYQSKRYMGLNGPCFGVDNPPDNVRAWLPLRSLIK